LNEDGEDNRLPQKVAGPTEPAANQCDAVKPPPPISLQTKPTQIITILANANGEWHCPVPNCSLSSKGFKREIYLANHVASNHEDSIRINFTYVGLQSNLSMSQRTKKRQLPPTDTSSPTTNQNTTFLDSTNTNSDVTSSRHYNGEMTVFQEQIHKYENNQIIRQHKNVIISGPEDREKLMRALRESGAIITSLSMNAPSTSND